jgi:hypothetical protein
MSRRLGAYSQLVLAVKGSQISSGGCFARHAFAWSATEKPVQETKFPAEKFFNSKGNAEIFEVEACRFFDREAARYGRLEYRSKRASRTHRWFIGGMKLASFSSELGVKHALAKPLLGRLTRETRLRQGFVEAGCVCSFIDSAGPPSVRFGAPESWSVSAFIRDRRSYGSVFLIFGVSTAAAFKRRAWITGITTREITVRDGEFADSRIYENDVAPISGASIRQRCGPSAMAIRMMMMLILVRLTWNSASLDLPCQPGAGTKQK